MIDAYVAKGPNPLKLVIFLEETQLESRMIWLDLTIGDHRTPEYLAMSPSAKAPVIVDNAPADGGGPVTIFESGAILTYLAEKTGQFLPKDPRGKANTLKWLFWQVAALGPISGQSGHFLRYAPGGNDYAVKRYLSETQRLYAALDHHLSQNEYVGVDYSIADMAVYPWVQMHALAGIELDPYPNVTHWLDLINARPAVVRAHQRSAASPRKVGTADQFRKNLFHDHCDPMVDVQGR